MFPFLKEKTLSKFAVHWAIILSSMAALVLAVLGTIDFIRWILQSGSHSMLLVAVILVYLIIAFKALVIFAVLWAILVLVGRLFKGLAMDTSVWHTVLAVCILIPTIVIVGIKIERIYLIKKIDAATDSQKLDAIAAYLIPNQHIEFFNQAVDQKDPVLAHVAANSYTSPALLSTLASSSKQYVKHAVAANAHTPPETLAALVREVDVYGDHRYIADVANNASTLPNLLEEIYQICIKKSSLDSYTKEALRALLRHPATPTALLPELRKRLPYFERD